MILEHATAYYKNLFGHSEKSSFKRCPMASDICKTTVPKNTYFGKQEMVNCWLYDKEAKTS